jgi:hypothetical protein
VQRSNKGLMNLVKGDCLPREIKLKLREVWGIRNFLVLFPYAVNKNIRRLTEMAKKQYETQVQRKSRIRLQNKKAKIKNERGNK